jgi:hypothetical protein
MHRHAFCRAISFCSSECSHVATRAAAIAAELGSSNGPRNDEDTTAPRSRPLGRGRQAQATMRMPWPSGMRRSWAWAD